jgi:hypothetical protein
VETFANPAEYPGAGLRPDVTETPTPAAIPALAAMATGVPPTTGRPPAEPATMAPIRPETMAPITRAIRREATAPTVMVVAMVWEGSMRPRSADRMATSTPRGFIVVGFDERRPD